MNLFYVCVSLLDSLSKIVARSDYAKNSSACGKKLSVNKLCASNVNLAVNSNIFGYLKTAAILTGISFGCHNYAASRLVFEFDLNISKRSVCASLHYSEKISVKQGQKLKTHDPIGTVATDSSGNTILHFQLRKETTKLNPEQWLGK